MPLAALVSQHDPKATSQERRVAHALLERGEIEIERLEDVRVGQEGDRGPGLAGWLALLQVAQWDAALVGLRPGEPVAANLDVEALGQCVDHGDADAVQPPRDLVAAALAELPAGVQNGEHDLDSRALLLLHGGHRNAAAVVAHANRVVGQDRHLDVIAVARQSLVDRVVDHLVDEVVKPAQPGRADVHSGSSAYRFEALQDRDVLCVVAALVVGAPCGAGVSCQRSSDDIETPRSAQPGARPGASKIVHTG